MDSATQLHCPRCAYDVSGVVPTWRDACPLQGTCSECGGPLDWPTLHNPMLGRNPRFVEHARPRSLLTAAWRTWLWALIPPWFWRNVSPSMPVVKHRWPVWLLVAWFTPGLITGLIDATAAGIGLTRGQAPSQHPVGEVAGAFLNGFISPGVSVGMESFDGTAHPGWAPIAGSTNQPPPNSGIPVRLNNRWGLRLTWPVTLWANGEPTPPGLPAAIAFSATLACLMWLAWLRWAPPEHRGTRFFRAAVFSAAWIPTLRWLDVSSACQRLYGALRLPRLPTNLPTLPRGLVTLWEPMRDSLYRENTTLNWLEHSAGIPILLAIAAWTTWWWWSAARAAFRPRLLWPFHVASLFLAALIAAAVLLWNFVGLVQYWRW